MKAHHLFPLLLLLFGLGTAQPADAQEIGVSLGGPRNQVSLSYGSNGFRATASSRDSGYTGGYGHGSIRSSSHSSRGRRIRTGYSDSHHVCIRQPIWIPGHYEARLTQVYIPASREKIWIEPVYECALDKYGRSTRILVRPGRWSVIEHPGHYEPHTEQVWIRGHNEFRTTCGH